MPDTITVIHRALLLSDLRQIFTDADATLQKGKCIQNFDKTRRRCHHENISNIFSACKTTKLQLITNTRVPSYNGLAALFFLQALKCPQLRKFQQIRRIRGICNISRIIKGPITLIVVVIISSSEWLGEIIYVGEILVSISGESI